MRSRTRTWQPLLTGASALRARATLDAIAVALREPLPAYTSPGASEILQATANVCVAGGSAGIALFYRYLAEATADDPSAERYTERATFHLDRAMDAVGTVSMAPALYGGFTGIAWTLQHFQSAASEDNATPSKTSNDDPLEEIDEALTSFLEDATSIAAFDLTDGLVGLGVYALERMPRPSARKLLRSVVDRLSALAEKVTPGAAWPTPPITPGGVPPLPGRYNLGLAHGQPGVIAFLSQTWLLEPDLRLRTEGLLSRAVAFLLTQQGQTRDGKRFPLSCGADAPTVAARCAWCYGDLGIATALLLAGRSLGEPSWERAAMDVALGASRLSVAESGVTDAGLCHGAAGLGHLFNRLWQDTGDEQLQQAGTRWFNLALDMRQEGSGIAGFRMDYRDGPHDEIIHREDPGLLTGTAGVGLALISATTDVEPDWDRLLLMSGPRSQP